MPYIQLKGEILSFETAGEGRQRRLIAHFSDGTGAVSYTHLDVYKRQIIHSCKHGTNFFKRFTVER